MPVSLSGVMFGAVTLNGGSSHDRPPENALSVIVALRTLRRVAIAAGQNSVDQIVAALDQIAIRRLRIGGASQSNCQTQLRRVPYEMP